MARVVRVVLDIYDDDLIPEVEVVACVRESVQRLLQGLDLNDAMHTDEFNIVSVDVA